MTTTDPSMGPDRRPASAADTLNSVAAGLAAAGYSLWLLTAQTLIPDS